MSTNDIGSATKALADAVSALTKSVTQNVSELGQDVNAQIAQSLRAASAELSEASVRIVRPETGAFRKRSEQTRAKLIEAAGKLFAERGFEAASLGDVAAEAGFTKGAVYANFANKQELLLAVAGGLAAADEEATDQSPGEALTEFCDPDTLDRSSLLALEIALYAARHPDIRPEIARLLGPSLDAMVGTVARARGSDPANPTPADRDATIGVVALRNYVSLLAPAFGDQEAADACRRLIERLLLN